MPCSCGCGLPRDRPGQRYRKDCHTAYMRDYRASQAARLNELIDAHRKLVILAGEWRAGCDCPPGPAECPVCHDRRARAAQLESIAGLVGTLARG